VLTNFTDGAIDTLTSAGVKRNGLSLKLASTDVVPPITMRKVW
jgi:hypothetical protein